MCRYFSVTRINTSKNGTMRKEIEKKLMFLEKKEKIINIFSLSKELNDDAYDASGVACLYQDSIYDTHATGCTE